MITFEGRHSEGVNWLRKAAEQGFAKAQYWLGLVYAKRFMHGTDFEVPPDYSEAAKWTLRSAEQRFEPAQYECGRMYEHGKGVEQDSEEARHWCEKAAVAGDAKAKLI
jgi:uncharacterized protein